MQELLEISAQISMSESLGVRPGHQYLKISRSKQVNGRLVGDGMYSEENTGSQEREGWDGWSASLCEQTTLKVSQGHPGSFPPQLCLLSVSFWAILGNASASFQ